MCLGPSTGAWLWRPGSPGPGQQAERVRAWMERTALEEVLCLSVPGSLPKSEEAAELSGPTFCLLYLLH